MDDVEGWDVPEPPDDWHIKNKSDVPEEELQGLEDGT